MCVYSQVVVVIGSLSPPPDKECENLIMMMKEGRKGLLRWRCGLAAGKLHLQGYHHHLHRHRRTGLMICICKYISYT